MNSSKLFLGGLMIAIGFYATTASAGLLDKINQATSRINQASQQIDNVNNAKNQVQGMGSKLPKPSAKNKAVPELASNHIETAPEGNALTPTTNPIKGEWGNQVTCAGPNSATCQNGLDSMVNCMHQSKGYWYRLVAANLEGRLGDQDLTDEDRAMLQADIASLKDAVNTDKVIDPDPQYPQRYMAWLTDEDQQEIQKINSKYMNEVRDDCDARFGGMARYSGK